MHLLALVNVRYFGILRETAKRREEKIEIDDAASALDLIELISTKHGQKFRNFVFDNKGKPNEGLAFAVNGFSLERSKLAKTKCKDISEFVILPPISGGLLSN